MRALNGGTEVSSPPLRLVVRGSIHKSFLTIASAKGMKCLVCYRDSFSIESKNQVKICMLLHTNKFKIAFVKTYPVEEKKFGL